MLEEMTRFWTLFAGDKDVNTVTVHLLQEGLDQHLAPKVTSPGLELANIPSNAWMHFDYVGF